MGRTQKNSTDILCCSLARVSYTLLSRFSPCNKSPSAILVAPIAGVCTYEREQLSAEPIAVAIVVPLYSGARVFLQLLENCNLLFRHNCHLQ